MAILIITAAHYNTSLKSRVYRARSYTIHIGHWITLHFNSTVDYNRFRFRLLLWLWWLISTFLLSAAFFLIRGAFTVAAVFLLTSLFFQLFLSCLLLLPLQPAQVMKVLTLLKTTYMSPFLCSSLFCLCFIVFQFLLHISLNLSGWTQPRSRAMSTSKLSLIKDQSHLTWNAIFASSLCLRCEST